MLSDMEIKKDSRLLKILLMGVVLVIVLVLLSTLLGSSKDGNDMSLVAGDKHQAVFLDNGEVYFGKITTANKSNLILEDIYYLRVTPTLQQSPDGTAVQDPNQQPQINLIKLGEELHGPEDKMVIPTSSIVYWENIENDGQVATAIAEAVANPAAAEEAAPAPLAQPAPAPQALTETEAPVNTEAQ